MHMIFRLLLIAPPFISCSVWASDAAITFAPIPATTATLRVGNHSVSFDVIDQKMVTHHGNIEFDTKKQVHVAVDDYSFDNRKGFSIWSIDEGMGVYTIHRVFLYSKDEFTFIEAHPACGDQFINLKVDKRRKRLVSTYYEDNVPKLCITRLPKVDAFAP